MIILWIKKRKTNENNGAGNSGKETFREHDEDMAKFRLTHPDMNIISSKDIITADGNILAPIQNVKLTEHAKN